MLRKYYPGGFTGFDVSGCPVWIIPYGNLDMKGKVMILVVIHKKKITRRATGAQGYKFELF